MSSERLLKIVMNSVIGYDLNPLAVICARANYIIALGEILSDCEGPIEIPVYLCDAMLTVLEGYEESEDCYIIPTNAETFILPKKLVDIKKVNNVMDIVNDCIHRGGRLDVFERQLIKELPELSRSLSKKEYEVLKDFYVKMEALNKKIWTVFGLMLSRMHLRQYFKERLTI